MRRLLAALLLAAPGLRAEVGGVRQVQDAAAAYRAGRLLDALTFASEALEADPRNAVAKNYIWIITKDLQKRRPRLSSGETEKAAEAAREYLESRRARTEKAVSELRAASRRSGDFRSPTGLLSALGEVQSLGNGVLTGDAGAQGQVYMANILANLQTALAKNVFVSRKEHLRAEGYLAYYKLDWPRAVSLWSKALKEDPSDRQIREDLSSLELMLKRDKERAEMKELVAQAETFQQTGLYAQAVEAWSEVARRDPRRPGVLAALTASRVSLEKVRQFKKLEEMNEAAAALYKQGRPMKAAEIWLEALQLDPTYQKARVWLKLVGKRLETSNEAPEEAAAPAAPAAQASSAAAPALVPTPAPQAAKAQALYKKGLVAYAGGSLEEAIRSWRAALAVDPSLNKAREALKQGESELSLTQQ